MSEKVLDLSAEVAADLPFLRRYARALTGSQGTGDRYALVTLEAVVTDPASIGGTSSVKVGLFRAFHKIWSSSGAPAPESEEKLDFLEAQAQRRLRALGPNTREALLLKTIEGFSQSEIAEIMEIDADEADALIATAYDDLEKLVSGNVLIIEDEAIIAMDLESIVTGMGHNVSGVARTRDGAVKMAQKAAPDLILADIQLADKSSGIDAVNDIFRDLGDVPPVIFITAFPERLLTGERPEPAFLITKPYSEDQVRTAVSQAMFFSSAEVLEAAN